MKIIHDDILAQNHGVLLHGCNASGAFGSGIAGQIRAKYPQAYEKFSLLKPSADLMGRIQIVYISEDFYICNGFTQLRYGHDGKRYASVSAIEQVIENALWWCHLHKLPLKTVKIGCGLGGLDWATDVEPIFHQVAGEYPDVEVTIFEK